MIRFKLEFDNGSVFIEATDVGHAKIKSRVYKHMGRLIKVCIWNARVSHRLSVC